MHLSDIYQGQTVRRFSVVQNRSGALFRMSNLPIIQLSLMKRGDKLKIPKMMPLELRTTGKKFL